MENENTADENVCLAGAAADAWRKEKARAERQKVNEAFNAVYNRHTHATYQKPERERTARDYEIGMRLRCMYDLALMLDGDALRTFGRCCERLEAFEATLLVDTSPFSLCWEGHGMYGGFIFHASCKEWSLHT